MQVTPGAGAAAEALCLAVWSAALERQRPAARRQQRKAPSALLLPGNGAGKVQRPALLTVTQHSAPPRLSNRCGGDVMTEMCPGQDDVDDTRRGRGLHVLEQ